MAVRVTRAGVWLTVGIIVVGLLVLGGLYIASQRGEQARRDEAIAVAENNLAEQSKNDGAVLNNGITDNDSKEDAKKDEAASNGGSTSDNKDTSGSTNTNTGNGGQTGGSVTELPQTGPADSLMTIVILAATTYAVFAYLGSRKRARSL